MRTFYVMFRNEDFKCEWTEVEAKDFDDAQKQVEKDGYKVLEVSVIPGGVLT